MHFALVTRLVTLPCLHVLYMPMHFALVTRTCCGICTGAKGWCQRCPLACGPKDNLYLTRPPLCLAHEDDEAHTRPSPLLFCTPLIFKKGIHGEGAVQNCMKWVMVPFCLCLRMNDSAYYLPPWFHTALEEGNVLSP